MASQDESELCENVDDNIEQSLMLPPQDETDPDLMQMDEDETQMPMHRSDERFHVGPRFRSV